MAQILTTLFSNLSLFLILIKLAMVSLHHGNQSVKQWLLDCMKCRLWRFFHYNCDKMCLDSFIRRTWRKGSHAYTITRFVAIRIPRRTIYRIIEVMERTWSTEGVAGSGPPASKLPHAARKRMAKAASNKVGITARKLCRTYGVASSFVTKVLKKKG